MLRVADPDIQGYDTFYKQLIAAVLLTNRDVALCNREDQVDDRATDSSGGAKKSSVLNRLSRPGRLPAQIENRTLRRSTETPEGY